MIRLTERLGRGRRDDDRDDGDGRDGREHEERGTRREREGYDRDLDRAQRTRGRERDRRGGEAPAIANELFETLYHEVVDRLDTGGIVDLDPGEVAERVQELVGRAIDERQIAVGSRGRRRVIEAITDEIVGLGPIERLLGDPTVSDILVNGADSIYVERRGVLERSEVRFRSNEHLLNTINRIVARIGRRIDESSPMVDARLPDGSRVNAIIPPLAVDGPLLSIRRFQTGPVSLRELIEGGSCSSGMAHYFKSVVRARCNVLVCGGTGSGKTTLLNALSRYIPSRERIITIEDSAELRLQQEHVARLETRPPNLEGAGEVTIRDLVRNALRMRPDRIIVGECRSEEVLDMIQAMNTGHDGSMTTVHANNVRDAFTRLMSMLSMAGTQLGESMMREMIARAIDVVINVSRGSDGTRRVISVAETGDVHQGEIELHEIFVWRNEPVMGRDEGHWYCNGHSTLMDRFRNAGARLASKYLAEVQ
ncbi:MAG: CpaF family protein [Myxococcales bacterium]|nr:CpaF family protein [Myxococcales bacterium]